MTPLSAPPVYNKGFLFYLRLRESFYIIFLYTMVTCDRGAAKQNRTTPYLQPQPWIIRGNGLQEPEQEQQRPYTTSTHASYFQNLALLLRPNLQITCWTSPGVLRLSLALQRGKRGIYNTVLHKNKLSPPGSGSQLMITLGTALLLGFSRPLTALRGVVRRFMTSLTQPSKNIKSAHQQDAQQAGRENWQDRTWTEECIQSIPLRRIDLRKILIRLTGPMNMAS